MNKTEKTLAIGALNNILASIDVLRCLKDKDAAYWIEYCIDFYLSPGALKLERLTGMKG